MQGDPSIFRRQEAVNAGLEPFHERLHRSAVSISMHKLVHQLEERSVGVQRHNRTWSADAGMFVVFPRGLQCSSGNNELLRPEYRSPTL